MKNASAKIDVLLSLLIERLQGEIADQGHGPTSAQLDELGRIVELKNKNNQRVAKSGKPPGPQSALPEESSEKLVEDLKKMRPPDLFPRRGPRNGKRESVSTPEPVDLFCAVHPEVVNVVLNGQKVCPECRQDALMAPPIIDLKHDLG